MNDPAEQKAIAEELKANWIWVPNWVDSSPENSAARIARFSREIKINSKPAKVMLHVSADTRYKLLINGLRVAVGPVRSSPSIWYYDSVDIAPYLNVGANALCFEVIRYFPASRGGMPFERSLYPGLTVVGRIDDRGEMISLNSIRDWEATVDESTQFPLGRSDDVFLHINELIDSSNESCPVTPVPYHFTAVNGELMPWRLQPRAIPLQEQNHAAISGVYNCHSGISTLDWRKLLIGGGSSLVLPAHSIHTLDVQAEVHSTAFIRWVFRAEKSARVSLKVVYSEGYEQEPRSYPFFRTKSNRLDAVNGRIIGPWDEVILEPPPEKNLVYEPFWFRTFRVMRWHIEVGSESVQLVSFDATQTNYPLDAKAAWSQTDDQQATDILDVSIRTMRNCMFDGYSDCPFYEQLQYAGDSRTVGLFHYLISGDDRLMRQCITNFAASIGHEGLTQSRFPSHVPQIIAGFSLYWVLQVCDHHIYFGDAQYARRLLPAIDGVLEFFHAHIDHRGLISGLPYHVWQFVDWVTTWGATDDHPDKGVPKAGRGTNCHTYFTLLYAFVLKQAARLTRDVGRPNCAEEYEIRAISLTRAAHTHCFDGKFFTDSTVEACRNMTDAYSQHCQVFAVLSGAVDAKDRARMLEASFSDSRFSKCSYMMLFYAFRAISKAGGDLYVKMYPTMWDPWRKMLANNLTTWEEDDVRQRSDCHAWGSVPIYEFFVEVAGLHVVEPGAGKLLFRPRLSLSEELSATACLGLNNIAEVSWQLLGDDRKRVELNLSKPTHVVSQLDGNGERDHGIIQNLILIN